MLPDLTEQAGRVQRRFAGFHGFYCNHIKIQHVSAKRERKLFIRVSYDQCISQSPFYVADSAVFITLGIRGMSVTIERLYKYGYINENSEALFSTAQVWCSAPSKLNDPFECRPWFTFDGNKDEIIESLARILHKNNPQMTQDTATAEAVAIYFQGRHRDPKTWEALRQDVVQMLGNKIGLYCLSRIPDSILMWSHYGYKHEGYCVEFEATDHTVVFGEAQPVLYSDSYPIVDFFKTPKEKQVDLIFLTKYTSWAYEQEWRIIDFQNGPGLRKYPVELLKSVTFGLCMSEPNKALIRKWVRRRDHDVEFFQADQDDRKFSIQLREVT